MLRLSTMKFLLILFTVLTVVSCKKDGTGSGGNYNQDQYPLKVGNKWTYYTSIKDTLGNTLHSYNLFWEVIRTDTALGKQVFVLEQVLHSVNANTYDTVYEYLLNDQTGLFGIAVQGNGGFSFFKAGGQSFSKFFGSDSIGRSNEKFYPPGGAIQILKYPYKVGVRWNRFKAEHSLWFTYISLNENIEYNGMNNKTIRMDLEGGREHYIDKEIGLLLEKEVLWQTDLNANSKKVIYTNTLVSHSVR